ncbi:MAG: cob(I)yrinic acid a,c-diamide adenosyltransferase [Parvibaculaceae bacterium]|nr:cob(I)yrinic acid a,c-diamide adenosyltransferase [Parvibaculaceae bacterium]HBM88391.1 cob(I)yrinic acid a,c-diamide adenosyltransferase [Rhodobiaceae bacterium]|tara:strand:+ start:13273 stop:13851 length:579 start_codon:yes stop_codon:yes gene_type:complete
MVVLNKIYTRTGDKGTTALGTGDRVAKHDVRVETYGTTDEVNSVLGLARLHTSDLPEIDTALSRIQNDLFDLGADLCFPESDEPLDYEPLRVTDAQVEWLEAEIDHLNGDLKPLNSFILPGGTPLAAHLHHARTVSRRAERLCVALGEAEPGKVSNAVLKYLNRLSDYLFVAARWCNDKGRADVLWTPGANR